MSSPGWGLHNFELALKRWNRAQDVPHPEIAERLEAWRTNVETLGLSAIEPWAVVDDDGNFVGRIPMTGVIASGVLLAHEKLVIVYALDGP